LSCCDFQSVASVYKLVRWIYLGDFSHINEMTLSLSLVVTFTLYCFYNLLSIHFGVLLLTECVVPVIAQSTSFEFY